MKKTTSSKFAIRLTLFCALPFSYIGWQFIADRLTDFCDQGVAVIANKAYHKVSEYWLNESTNY